MKKSIEILKKLKPGEKYYRKKVKLLAELILDPDGGINLPKELIEWSQKVGLRVDSTCDSGISWWSVWER